MGFLMAYSQLEIFSFDSILVIFCHTAGECGSRIQVCSYKPQIRATY